MNLLVSVQSGNPRLLGKTFLQISFFFLLATQICFGQWFWQNLLPTGNYLRSVKFISSEIGWTVGAGGTIIKTTDGGDNWIQQASGTTNNLYGLCFTDINNDTAVGDDGTILRTKDSGTNMNFTNKDNTPLGKNQIQKWSIQ